MSAQKHRVLLYGDVNLNIIDGSAVWLVAVAEALSTAGDHVTVLTKAVDRGGRLYEDLRQIDGVDVVYPRGLVFSETPALTVGAAASEIESLDSEREFDVLLCRGRELCSELVRRGIGAGKLWAYLTDIPDIDDARGGDARRSVHSIAIGAHRLMVQTEDARALLEASVPAGAGKTVLMPPMVPDDIGAGRRPVREGGALRLGYCGKFAADWNTHLMLDLPAALRSRGTAMSLTLVGDKFQQVPGDPGWAAQMKSRLVDAHAVGDVVWRGGVSRRESLQEIAGFDLALSWRSHSLDSSREISTKLLEYCAAGVAAVVNRTAAHEKLLGADYPYFVDHENSVESVIERGARDRAELLAVSQALPTLVESHRSSAVGALLHRYFDRSAPSRETSRRSLQKVLVASHDLKFARDVIEACDSDPQLQVNFDHWQTLHVHDEHSSRKLLVEADIVFCEWAGPNSVWYSKNVRPGQRLIIRFHGFEVRGPWIGELDIGAVEKIVFVSEFFRDQVVELLGWPLSKTVIIPNSIDTVDLKRPKILDAQHHIGILGISPVIKRIDRAIDLLEALLVDDDRFILHVKGRPPWDYAWEWKKPEVRDYYGSQFRRALHPRTRDNIVFEEFGPDVGSWYQNLGWILSPSARETFHMAPLEGMASGAVPLFWERDGVGEIFGEEWVVEDSTAAAEKIRGSSSEDWKALGRHAERTADNFDLLAIRPSWLRLLRGDL